MIRTALALSFPVVCWCLACAAMIPFPATADPNDEVTLKQLNQKYVESFLKSDVTWYQQHTTDDFICIESDGAIYDKPAFLQGTAKGPGVADYKLVDVQVRILGDTALIHAQGKATRHDGSVIISRYTDVYVRQRGEWKAASAQITRIGQTKAAS